MYKVGAFDRLMAKELPCLRSQMRMRGVEKNILCLCQNLFYRSAMIKTKQDVLNPVSLTSLSGGGCG